MDDIGSDELTQIVMCELVRQLAATLAAIAVYDDRYVTLPNISSLLLAELAAQLTERGVPARVAAGLLGMSRRSFFRYRAQRPEFRQSHLADVMVTLSDGPQTRQELLGALANADVSALESTLRFLVERGVVIERDGWYELARPDAGDEIDDLELVLETVAANRLPLHVDELAAELGQDPEFIREAVRRLERQERLVVEGETIVGGPDDVEFVSKSHRATILGLFHTTRTFFGGIRRRLDGGRTESRTLTWSFEEPPGGLDEVFGSFIDVMDGQWRADGSDTTGRRLTAMLSWFSDPS